MPDVETLKFRNFHLKYLLEWANSPLVAVRRELRKFTVPVFNVYQAYNTERNEILTKYCDKKEDGTPDTEIVGTQTNYQFKKLDEETMKKFTEEITALDNEFAVIDILPSMTGAVIRTGGIMRDLNVEIDGNTPEGQMADAAYEGICNVFDEYENPADGK